MEFITLIPTHLNDGTPVSPATLQRIVTDLADEFGGCTNDGTVEGQWISEGQRFEDTNIRVRVVCDNDRYDDAKQAVIAIGRELQQLAMYFEVRYFDGIQILEID